MKITIFNNLYSKEAQGVIDAAEWRDAIRDGKYKTTVEGIRAHLEAGRKDEAGKLKMKLPAVVFAGDCRKGRFYAKTTERTGWAMFDFDNLTPEQARAARDLLGVCPWVAMAHITSSGRGLRVVVNIGLVHIDVYRDAYERVAERLTGMTGLAADMQCKDFARTSLASYDPEIIFNPEATVFDYGEECNPLRYVPATGPDTSEDFRIPTDVFAGNDGGTKVLGQSAASRTGQSSGTHTDTEAVIERFFSMNTYSEGNRHRTLLHLGSYLKWRGVEGWQMDDAIARICRRAVQPGMTEREVRNAVIWGYNHGQEGTKNVGASAQSAQMLTMSTFSPEGTEQASDNEDITEENETEKDENEIISEHCPSIPDRVFENLPEELKKLLVIAKDKRDRDVILLSAITNLSGLFPAIRTIYGNKKYSAHLYTALVAAAGSGKGLAAYSALLGSKIHDALEKKYQEEKKEYEKKMMVWELEVRNAMKDKRIPDTDLKPEEPVRQMLLLPANMSKSQMMHDLKALEGIGGIINSLEIDAMTEALGSDYGNHAAELRMFFHHEQVGQRFKIDKDPVIIQNPMLAMLLTGTPEQISRFIKSLENGMHSRILYYMMESRYVWKSQSPLDRNGNINAEDLFRQLAVKLKENFFNSVGKEIMINFTKEQWDRHKEVFRNELALVAAEGIAGATSIVTRAGLIAVRVAMVLCGLRIMEAGWQVNEYTCPDEDFESALSIVLTGLKHSAQVSTMIKNESLRNSMRNFYYLFDILKKMNNTFRYFEFRDAVIKSGSNVSAARRALERYTDNGLLVKSGMRGRYDKTEKLKKMLR